MSEDRTEEQILHDEKMRQRGLAEKRRKREEAEREGGEQK